MKKMTTIIIILILISLGILSGCNEQSTTQEKSGESPPIQNQAPTAQASANKYSGNVPLTVEFVGSGVDTDGTIISYSWNFGDGSTSNQPNPSHTYSNAGTYTVKLTVTDDKGLTGIDTISITVNSNPLSEKLIGRWDNLRGRISDSWIFTSDGKLTLDDQTIDYTLDGNYLSFTQRKHYTVLGKTHYYSEYDEFSIEFDNENTLILTFRIPSEFSGDTIVLTR